MLKQNTRNQYWGMLCAIFVTILLILCIGQNASTQEYPSGMVSYWKFDEKSGAVASDSLGFNDGTLINGPVWTTGQVNGALSFDGEDDYVYLGTTFGQSFTDFTVESWVKKDAEGCGTIIGQWHNAATESLFFFFHPTPDELIFQSVGLNQEGVKTARIDITSVDTTEWHHYAAVFRATSGVTLGDVTFYINGLQTGDSVPNSNSGIREGPQTEPHTISIGASIPPPGKKQQCYLRGTIDEVAIYDRALTQEEIWQHYQNGLQGLGYEEKQDTDGDGVTDDDDNCPDSDLIGTVVIDGCDSGVENVLFPNGCTLVDLVNHALSGGDEDAFEDFIERLEAQWILTEEQAEDIEDCAEDREDDDDDDSDSDDDDSDDD